MVHVLQLTDTHLYARSNTELYHVNTRSSLQSVVHHARRSLPEIDVVLVTGDLVHDESKVGYQALQELMQSMAKPVYYIPGNHDCHASMMQVLGNFNGSGFQIATYQNWSILLLDSAVNGCVDGEISPDILDQLEAYLVEHSTQSVLVALHHHVLNIQSPWLDALNLRNGEELKRILEQHKQVKVVINGHIHQELDEIRSAIRYLGTPSTCFQFKPKQDHAVIDTKPPGYRYLVLGDDGSVETQVYYVEGYDEN